MKEDTDFRKVSRNDDPKWLTKGRVLGFLLGNTVRNNGVRKKYVFKIPTSRQSKNQPYRVRVAQQPHK